MTAAHQNLVPTWTPFLTLLGSVLLAFMSSIAPAKDDPPSKLPTVLLFVGAAALASSVSACAAFQKALPFLPKAADVECVATDVERGVTDPLRIVSDCPQLAEIAVADIEALIVNLVSAKKAAHRAAVEHGATCSDAGTDAK